MSRLVDDLDHLHQHYREAVNLAIADDDLPRAEALAEAYDSEATTLIAEWEGLTHLLPLKRQGEPTSRLRTLVQRVRRGRAA